MHGLGVHFGGCRMRMTGGENGGHMGEFGRRGGAYMWCDGFSDGLGGGDEAEIKMRSEEMPR